MIPAINIKKGVITVLMFFVLSCSKKTPPNVPDEPYITVNTVEDFGGQKLFDVKNVSTTIGTTGSSSVKPIQLFATVTEGTTVRTVFINLLVPTNANTSSGNITINLASQSGSLQAHLTLSTHTVGFGGPSYDSESGTLVITELTTSKIKGTFSGRVVNAGNPSLSLSISSGSFEGRF